MSLHALHRPHRRGRPRSRAALLSAALCAVLPLTALTALAGPPGAGAAEDPPVAPTLRLSMPARQVVESWGPRVYTDLGIRLLVEGADLEVHLNRSSYDDPITASLKLSDGSLRTLGDDLTPTLNRLRRFLVLRFEPLGDREPFTRGLRACLGQVSDRVDPDAAPSSPYPRYCYYNPYSLGAVQGIPAGYAGTIGDPWRRMEIPRGRYDVSVTVARRWAAALGMSQDQRTATTRLVVRKEPSCGVFLRGCRPHPTRPARPDAELRPSAVRPTPARAVDPGDLPPDTPQPDLRALPAWGLQISRNGNFLQFAATVWNAGDSPLVVDGFRRSGEDLMDGYQYFFDAEGHQLPDYVRVGSFEWDPKRTHQHWHFRSFASYSLLPVGERPDVAGEHDHGVESRKEAFCLANTDAVDLTVDGAVWNVDNSDLSTACGDLDSLSIREVLDSGWGDTYAQFRAGQSFKLRGLPNGCYNIWVEGNPIAHEATGARTLIESDYTNNISSRKVCIGGKDGARTIRRVEQIGLVQE
ncbi:hypothetical protein E8D34_14585 [Nocardioides sp. GY 10113]|uniref:hypothetical protein n=1 Tax=Nocardioides sp. GY 10113 TaxID=2569761 RepID=UPI0010A8744B|nr:hypothetical protein [Nocardioides sp. GY 10113]TIC79751.1 hypothetical protein E8D34_19795 [Nocardioides sp. GY 10113]TIC84921.1 hypothetical protein E8D34_14585 [Nocardioides sp. GY 10113]